MIGFWVLAWEQEPTATVSDTVQQGSYRIVFCCGRATLPDSTRPLRTAHAPPAPRASRQVAAEAWTEDDGLRGPNFLLFSLFLKKYWYMESLILFLF